MPNEGVWREIDTFLDTEKYVVVMDTDGERVCVWCESPDGCYAEAVLDRGTALRLANGLMEFATGTGSMFQKGA